MTSTTPPPPSPTESDIAFTFSTQLRARFIPSLGAMWLYWFPRPRPCFNESLLVAYNAFADFMQHSGGVVTDRGRSYPIKSLVLASDVGGVFNLGVDCTLFAQLVERRDRDGLRKYATTCVDTIYRHYDTYQLPITTISLVQGKCLGSGFEAALSSHVIIAERSSQFGFPEAMWDLYPGLAMTALIRLGNFKLAEAMTTSADLYTADALFALGLIDVVVNDGEGPAAVDHYLRMREPKRRSIFQLRKISRAVNRKDLDDTILLWTEAALRINDRELRLMQAYLQQSIPTALN